MAIRAVAASEIIAVIVGQAARNLMAI